METPQDTRARLGLSKDLNQIKQPDKSDQDFMKLFTDVCKSAQCPEPAWMYVLISFESRWNPTLKNPESSARGLIQFIDEAAQQLGYGSSLELVQKFPTIGEQLNGPVREHFIYWGKQFGAIKSEQDLYMRVFYPTARDWSLGYEFPPSVQKVNGKIKYVIDYVNHVRARAKVPLLPRDGIEFVPYTTHRGQPGIGAEYKSSVPSLNMNQIESVKVDESAQIGESLLDEDSVETVKSGRVFNKDLQSKILTSSTAQYIANYSRQLGYTKPLPIIAYAFSVSGFNNKKVSDDRIGISQLPRKVIEDMGLDPFDAEDNVKALCNTYIELSKLYGGRDTYVIASLLYGISKFNDALIDIDEKYYKSENPSSQKNNVGVYKGVLRQDLPPQTRMRYNWNVISSYLSEKDQNFQSSLKFFSNIYILSNQLKTAGISIPKVDENEPLTIVDENNVQNTLKQYMTQGLFTVKETANINNLRPEIVKIIPEVSKIHAKYSQTPMVITSGNDGKHGDNSKHYVNLAIDIRTKHMKEEDVIAFEKDLKQVLGSAYFVLLEDLRKDNEHIHIQTK